MNSAKIAKSYIHGLLSVLMIISFLIFDSQIVKNLKYKEYDKLELVSKLKQNEIEGW